MGLKDYVVPTTTITLAPSDNTVTVRGLNFADITKLVNNHGPVLILLYGRVWAEVKAGSLDAAKVGQLIQTTLFETPLLIAETIAIASDEPDAVKQAAKLPPGVQVELVSAIIGHTFISEVEVKKLVEIATTMLERLGGLATTLTSEEPSTDGSSASGDA